MSTILETTGLTKRFGRITAVSDLSLSIEEGMIFGMLGPNGSGKTTTLGMILGVTIPTSGNFTWFSAGNDNEVRKKIGAILEHPVFYPYMSAYENLRLVCIIKNISVTRIENVLEIVGLTGRMHDPFKTYSLGMKQRLAIASALLCDPRVMILDEPTNGLDPQGIADIRQLILQIAETGKTIILASHLLDEVQKVCSHFCVLNRGHLLYTGNVRSDLSAENTFDIAASNEPGLIGALQKSTHVLSFEKSNGVFKVKVREGISGDLLNKELTSREVFVHHLVAGKKSLEDQFLKILQENNEKTSAN